jgi:hypothetical protein
MLLALGPLDVLGQLDDVLVALVPLGLELLAPGSVLLGGDLLEQLAVPTRPKAPAAAANRKTSGMCCTAAATASGATVAAKTATAASAANNVIFFMDPSVERCLTATPAERLTVLQPLASSRARARAGEAGGQ